MAEGFGIWLRSRRKSKGWSQEHLAREINHICKAGYISNLERNSYRCKNGSFTRPSIQIVDAIAIALGESSYEARLQAGYAPPAVSETKFSEKIRFICSEAENWGENRKSALIEAIKNSIALIRDYVPDGDGAKPNIKKAKVVRSYSDVSEEEIIEIKVAAKSRA